MDYAVSAYINYLRIAGRANSALLAGSGDSDARHTDKLFFANRTFIAALIAIKVFINIAPISMHRFAAAFADKHIAALCTAYGTVVLLFSTAPNHENPNLFSIGEGFGFFVFFGNENNGSSLTAVCPKPYQKDRITKVTTVRVP